MKIVLFSILFISIIIIAIYEKGNPLNQLINPTKKVSAEEFIDTLDSLGYYKYADKVQVDILKKDQSAYFDPEATLTTIWDDDTGIPLDYRYYFCDGETVFEQGGITDLLQQIQPTLDKIGLTISTSNHTEAWDDDNKWLNHSITVNGTEYEIFKNFKGYGWGEAVMRFAQIINTEAKKQGVEEQIYLISGGNDGGLVFLTESLYDYIYDIYSDDQWKPLAVKEWAKVNKIKYSEIKTKSNAKTSIHLKHFGNINLNQTEEYQDVQINIDGNDIELDINFDYDQISEAKIKPTATFLNNLEKHVNKAKQDLITDYTNGRIVKGYIRHHLTEFNDEELKALGINPKDDQASIYETCLSKIHLKRIGLYPEYWDSLAVFDFTISSEFTQYLIVLKFDSQGHLVDIVTES
ncbi:DUF2004 domain-containing protein [Psychroserpens algicola]|uniref:DUF2004 domain-containing protein n=1 Tax=Psychroserpens algicola TaxID=1719034 RepID=A0ABT0HBF7_9FLAO|nr:DUF2004 domain-containing protein [Psychroserpens algicola]MCK8481661.1 DUF2004 domain-containing protein [Psychroserpens algicola]